METNDIKKDIQYFEDQIKSFKTRINNFNTLIDKIINEEKQIPNKTSIIIADLEACEKLKKDENYILSSYINNIEVSINNIKNKKIKKEKQKVKECEKIRKEIIDIQSKLEKNSKELKEHMKPYAFAKNIEKEFSSNKEIYKTASSLFNKTIFNKTNNQCISIGDVVSFKGIDGSIVYQQHKIDKTCLVVNKNQNMEYDVITFNSNNTDKRYRLQTGIKNEDLNVKQLDDRIIRCFNKLDISNTNKDKTFHKDQEFSYIGQGILHLKRSDYENAVFQTRLTDDVIDKIITILQNDNFETRTKDLNVNDVINNLQNSKHRGISAEQFRNFHQSLLINSNNSLKK